MGDFAASVERPRVLHVAQTVAGGIASYFEEIAEYQNQRFGPHNVAFVVPEGAERFARLDFQQLISFQSASRSPSGLLDFVRVARGAIRRFEPDIVHLHSSFAGALVRGMLAHWRARPALVYCPHGWAFGIEAPAAKRASYAFIERRLAQVADAIHVNSHSEYVLGLKAGIPAQKMRVVSNAIAWMSPPEQKARQGPLRVAFIGRHDRQKGLDILLDTIRRFPLGQIQFDIVGDRILAEPSVQKNIDAHVRFHGWLSRGEILELLDDVDAVVMPSRWEAFGLVAIEAMRAGVPVIASNRGALPEVVQDGCAGIIFDLDDPDALGAVLKAVSRKQLKGLGRAARERWERHYVADRMNHLVSDMYADVLAAAERGQVPRVAAAAPSRATR